MAPAPGSVWWVISYNPASGPSTYQYFFGTSAGAEARANLAVDGSVTGPFQTKAEAQAAVKAHHVTPPKGDSGQINVGNPLSGIDAVGDLAHRLTEASTWERVAEVGIGLVLLYVAVKAMFPGAVSAVAEPVKTAAKVGMLA